MLAAEVVDLVYIKAVERLTDLGICALVQVGLLLVLYFSMRDLNKSIHELIKEIAANGPVEYRNNSK